MSKGLIVKTSKQLAHILKLMDTPMTVRECSRKLGIKTQNIRRSVDMLFKAECIEKIGRHVEKGLRTADIYQATGKEFVYSSNRGKVQGVKVNEHIPKRIIKDGNCTVYNLSFHDKYTMPPSKSACNYISGSTLSAMV